MSIGPVESLVVAFPGNRFGQLKNAGVITEEEFQAKKKPILGI